MRHYPDTIWSALLSLCSLSLLFSARAPAQGAASITDLGSLGGSAGMAQSVNGRGQVVGWAYTTDGFPHAFLYDGGMARDLGTLGGTFSIANAVNASGMVAGQASTAGDAAHHAFLHDGARMRDLGTLGGSYSTAYGVDSIGRAVGVSTTSGDAAFHAFIHDGGVMRDLGTLGGSSSIAYDINASGQVAGWAYPAGVPYPHAFLYEGGRMRDLGTLGGSASMAVAMNDTGQVVGGSFPASSYAYHAFLADRVGMKDLGTLGGSYSFAHDVNTSGQVVGEAQTAGDASQHAFLYSQGVIKDLNSLLPAGSGWVLSQALGINDAGQVVGIGTRNGQQRAYLLSPAAAPVVPPVAPATLAADVPSPSQVDLRWSDSSSNETDFTIWRRSASSDWTRVADVAADVSAYTDSSVRPDTTYSYRVRALNASGASPWSNEASAVTPPPPPTPPSELSVAMVSPTQLDLVWNDTSNGETAVEVWRKTTMSDWSRVALLGANVTRYSDGDLTQGVGCTYRVRAIGRGGPSDWSNLASGPQPLAAPGWLHVRNGSPYLVYLEWVDNSTNETGFELQRKVNDEEFQTMFILPKNRTSFYDFQLSSHTSYTYRMRAVGPDGPSAWSNEVRWTNP